MRVSGCNALHRKRGPHARKVRRHIGDANVVIVALAQPACTAITPAQGTGRGVAQVAQLHSRGALTPNRASRTHQHHTDPLEVSAHACELLHTTATTATGRLMLDSNDGMVVVVAPVLALDPRPVFPDPPPPQHLTLPPSTAHVIPSPQHMVLTGASIETTSALATGKVVVPTLFVLP